MAVKLNALSKLLLVLMGLGLIVYAIYKYGEAGKTDRVSDTGKKELASTTEVRKDVLTLIRANKILRVGMEADAPPMNFFAEGKRQGFDYEIANLIGSKMGVNRVEIVESKYDKLPNLLRNGTIDLMMGGYVPDPAIAQVDWSEGYLDFGLCLIVKQGSAIRELKHLEGKKVGTYKDPAAVSWVRENVAPAMIKEYEGTNWFKALDNGEVDAIIYDYPFTVKEIRQFPKLRIVKLNLNASQYAVGLPSNNDDLLSVVNTAIREIVNSPDYENLVRKYLTTDAVQVVELPKGSKVYLVKAGDSLSGIAQKQLGDKEKWKTIYELNKNRLANPHLLSVGMQLLMP